MSERGVPVVMYHGVGPDRPLWQWNRLITPVEVFESQMRALRDQRWTTVALRQLYDHLATGAKLPPKPVVLTFDDGYLDNYVFAYPILKKYGHRAVIWMSTDFVDPATQPRPTLDDLWEGRIGWDDLTNLGYLSWAEMNRMVHGGHVEIQSHAETHTWYYSGPEIIDFHRPAGIDGYVPYPWLGWNSFPERKYESMSARLEELVPYGTPVYRHGKSLVTRRYFEDGELTGRLVDTVRRGGGASFFEAPDWRRVLSSVVNRHPPKNDRIETEREYESRVREELVRSRRIIEEALGTRVDFLCWPGGGRSSATLRIAEQVGYLATTTHFQDASRRNTFGQDPREISRMGCGSPWSWRGRNIRGTDPGFFIAGLELFAGNKKSIWTIRLYKLKYLIRYFACGKT